MIATICQAANPSRLALCLQLCVLAFAGCTPATSHVSGTVMIDDVPLETGVIVFVSLENEDETPSRGDVLEGKYEVETKAGRKLVQISAPVTENLGGYVVLRERLPPQYHSESKLEFQVKPGRQVKHWQTRTK